MEKLLLLRSSSPSSSEGLTFGKKIYLEDVGGSPAKKWRSTPRCQVEGCLADLSEVKAYYSRHKVCGLHSKSPKVIVAGIQQRFCQQCSRFHELVEFDQGKRSCRRRLAGHNARRRKPTPGSHVSLPSSSQSPGYDSKSGGLMMGGFNNINETWANAKQRAGAGAGAGAGALSLLSNYNNNYNYWPGTRPLLHPTRPMNATTTTTLVSNNNNNNNEWVWGWRRSHYSWGGGFASCLPPHHHVQPAAAATSSSWGFKDDMGGSDESPFQLDDV